MIFSLKHNRPSFRLIIIIAIGFFVTIISQPVVAQTKNVKLRFLDLYTLPHNPEFEGTTVGGLSGIDYDKSEDIYYSISDDRSKINPARFYTLKIDINGEKIDSVWITGKTFLKNSGGNYFPPSSRSAGTVDPESLRKWNDQIIWSSEGDRIYREKDTTYINAAIFVSDLAGNLIDTFSLPDQVHISNPYTGIRRNGGFEGLAISPDKKFLFASIEEPLLQDGPRAGLGDSTGINRIIQFDILTKNPIAQYAYITEPVAHPVFQPNANRINGISEIMCLSDNQLLVMERSFSTGRLSCTIRLFIADLSQAEDVSSHFSLQGKEYQTLPKELIFNTDDLGIYIDNIEGVTYGPKLANGDQSLIFIADNNFNPLEKNQILLFEIAGE